MTDNYVYVGAARLAYGTLTAKDLTSAYNVESFPRQADQPHMVDWLEFLNGSDIVSLEAAIEIGMDGTAARVGGFDFTLYFGYLSPFMFKYILDTFFPDGAASSDLTVMVFDRMTGWRAINAKAIRPRAADGTPAVAAVGWERMPIRFLDGADAPAGYAFDNAFSNDFDAPDS